jgi:hypothetical protein
MFWFKKETQEEKLKRKYLQNISLEKYRMERRLEEQLNLAIKNTQKSFEFTTHFEDRLEIVCKELGVKFQFICERSLFDKGLKKFKIYGWAEETQEELQPKKETRTTKERIDLMVEQQLERLNK